MNFFMAKPQALLIFGSQGSGKGEQAKRIAEHFDLELISMGDTLRKIAKEESPRGRHVDQVVNREGKLLSDDLTFEILGEALEKSFQKGFILDGYPRSLEQLQTLEKFLSGRNQKIDKAFYLEVSPATSIARLTQRRVCQNCGRTYNLVTDPPKKEGVCDDCGGLLVKRSDDQSDLIRNRLEIYQRQTTPLIEYFGQKGILEKINGEMPIKDVFEDIKRKIK